MVAFVDGSQNDGTRTVVSSEVDIGRRGRPRGPSTRSEKEERFNRKNMKSKRRTPDFETRRGV